MERRSSREPLPSVVLPGSPDTLKTLRGRASRGEQLFAKADVTDADEIGQAVEQNPKNSSHKRLGLVPLQPGSLPLAGFGARLHLIRTGRRMSQRQLGLRAGLSSQAVSMIERGKRKPNLSSFVAFADALKLSLDALLGRTSPAAG